NPHGNLLDNASPSSAYPHVLKESSAANSSLSTSQALNSSPSTTTTGTRSPYSAASSGSWSTLRTTNSAPAAATTGVICSCTRLHDPQVVRTINSTVWIALLLKFSACHFEQDGWAENHYYRNITERL